MANNFKNSFASAISTDSASPTIVYTANNGSGVNSILIELDVANVGTSAVQVSVLIYDSSASESFHIVKNAPVPTGGALKVVSGQKVVLNSDDEVRVYASSSEVDVVASILEDVA